MGEYAPDLAIEILSESNRPTATDRKRREYFRNGTRLVWIIDPQRKTVDAFTAPDSFTTLGIQDTLEGGDILPGFSLPLIRLFGDPQVNPRADA